MKPASAIENEHVPQDPCHTRLAAARDYIVQLEREMNHRQRLGVFMRGKHTAKNHKDLIDMFLDAAGAMFQRASIRIQSAHEDVLVRGTPNLPSSIELSILELPPMDDKIHGFGHDRTLFDWGDIRLLATGVEDNSDMLAMMLDGLSRSVRLLDHTTELKRSIEARTQANQLLHQHASDLTESLKTQLGNMLTRISLLSNLSQDDQDTLDDVVDNYFAQVDAKLYLNRKNDFEILDMIEELSRMGGEFNEDNATCTTEPELF